MNPNPQTPDELAKAVRNALRTLQVRQPFFYSENDFQGGLVREMEAEFSNIRREDRKRLKENSAGKESGIIDITARFGGTPVFVEAKHKMKEVSQEMHDAGFQRGNDGVGDSRRYLFWKDVWRLAHLDVNADEVRRFALLLTNREKFWDEPIHKLQRVPSKHGIPASDIHALCEKYGDDVQRVEWPTTNERGICKCIVVEVRP